MTHEKGPNKKSPLRSREVLSIGLAGIASSLGYLALLAVIIDHVAAPIHGNYSASWLANWLAKVWLFSAFFAFITVPISLALALLATFLPLGKRAKIIIWLVVVGGGLGWLLAGSPIR